MEKARKWIEVANKLEEGVLTINCPFCGHSTLQVRHEIWPNGKKMDTYVHCESCGEHTVFGGVDFEASEGITPPTKE
jgi:transcription elongation factor Elf1